jgi:hypothetical protein
MYCRRVFQYKGELHRQGFSSDFLRCEFGLCLALMLSTEQGTACQIILLIYFHALFQQIAQSPRIRVRIMWLC